MEIFLFILAGVLFGACSWANYHSPFPVVIIPWYSLSLQSGPNKRHWGDNWIALHRRFDHTHLDGISGTRGCWFHANHQRNSGINCCNDQGGYIVMSNDSAGEPETVGMPREEAFMLPTKSGNQSGLVLCMQESVVSCSGFQLIACRLLEHHWSMTRVGLWSPTDWLLALSQPFVTRFSCHPRVLRIGSFGPLVCAMLYTVFTHAMATAPGCMKGTLTKLLPSSLFPIKSGQEWLHSCRKWRVTCMVMSFIMADSYNAKKNVAANVGRCQWIGDQIRW
jgi:hypothetical protein